MQNKHNSVGDDLSSADVLKTIGNLFVGSIC